MHPAIRVDGISKLYQVGARQQGYKTLRESIVDACWAPVMRLSRSLESRNLGFGVQGSAGRGQETGASNQERLRGTDFWALKDVSFEVQPGEVVGIIGRNGAGKSTLLKILSRITEPTAGRIELRGRVGSLLEVGTGFHPELTGRENIYMNGSILGMSQREISRKFDEIVAFAEIEDFLETPVKRYSSGMYVRLAFAVAAHLELEILMIDEVLAVGDAAFQRKCLGKIGEAAHSGRTVLFVSHSMATISNMCQEVLLLDGGELIVKGDTHEGLTRYMTQSSASGGAFDLREHPNRRKSSKVIFKALRLRTSDNLVTDQIRCGEPLCFELDIRPWCGATKLDFSVIIHDGLGTKLFTVGSYLSESRLEHVNQDQCLSCSLDNLPLSPGRYSLSLCAGPLHQFEIDVIDQAAWFDVIDGDFYGNGRFPHPGRGTFLMQSTWSQSAASNRPERSHLATRLR